MKKVMLSKLVNRNQLKIELMDYLIDSNEGEISGESVRFVYDQIIDAVKQGFSFDQLRSWALDEGITIVEALDLYNKHENTDIDASPTMKKLVYSSFDTKNAVAIAEEAFGKYFRENPYVSIYKQSKGYALKYIMSEEKYSKQDADRLLKRLKNIADELDIPVIRSSVKNGSKVTNIGFVLGYVVSIVVPEANDEND